MSSSNGMTSASSSLPMPKDLALERVAGLFSQHYFFEPAIAAICRLVERHPTSAGSWHTLGNAFARLSQRAAPVRMLTVCVQCLHRALQIDPQLRPAAELIEFIKKKSPLDPSAIDAVPPYAASLDLLLDELKFTPAMLVRAVRALPTEHERATAVVCLGMQGEERFAGPVYDALAADVPLIVHQAAISVFANVGRYPPARAAAEHFAATPRALELARPFAHALRETQITWAHTLLRDLAGMHRRHVAEMATANAAHP